MILWACRGIFLSISLRTGIYYSHLGFGLKWTEVDESGGVWQVPAPVVLKKLQFGSVSEFLDFSNMSSQCSPGSLTVHRKSHSCHCLRGFSRWEKLPHLPHLPQRLFQMGGTTQGPSVPAPTAAQVAQADNFNGSSFGMQFKFILEIPKTKS